MRLLVTGLVVRASCNARLRSHIAGRTCLNPYGGRWASSQAAVEDVEWPADSASSPAQAVTTGREVGPGESASSTLATKNSSKLPEETVKTIREEIKRSKPNTVVHGYGESGTLISGTPYVFDKATNLSPSILELLDRNLYNTPDHPICITRRLIESVFPAPTFDHHVASNPVVTAQDNFDVLGFPEDHPGRSRTDTYYVDSTHVLRTHTSTHQHLAFQRMRDITGSSGYTICADVFRRDSIDRSHMPVFHQMEGAYIWKYERNPARLRETRYEVHMQRQEAMKMDLLALSSNLEYLDIVVPGAAFDQIRNPPQPEHDEQDVRLMATHLKRSLERLVVRVFLAAKEAGVAGGNVDEKLKVRWVDAYFPFTSPSFELEVFWQGEWLELLGCGVVQQTILRNAGLPESVGWAWGIGVERLAMLLFGIPDIRLFWSKDKRFLDQFKAGKITKYEPFSKYPACYKDVAFWIDAAPAAASPVGAASSTGSVAAAAGGDATKASPTESQPAAFHENDVMEIVRDVAGSLAEDVKLVDEFLHPSTGRKSLCYRINYRSLEKTLTNEEVNKMHDDVVARIAAELDVELR